MESRNMNILEDKYRIRLLDFTKYDESALALEEFIEPKISNDYASSFKKTVIKHGSGVKGNYKIVRYYYFSNYYKKMVYLYLSQINKYEDYGTKYDFDYIITDSQVPMNKIYAIFKEIDKNVLYSTTNYSRMLSW